MAKKRQAFDGNYVALVREMEAARRQLAELPDAQEFTQDQIANLDDVRHAALRLADMAEATIKLFQGR